MEYETIIVGGGIAGLQAAIQLGRYEHRVLVIDSGYGRSTICRSFHNILGWPDGVSGEELRSKGQMHAQKLGIEFVQDEVVRLEKKKGGGFMVETKLQKPLTAHTLLIATGLMDRFPSLPGILPCLGLSIYVCPDCDGYEVKNKKTVIIGAGDAGAYMAKILTYWTDQLIYINHEQAEVKKHLLAALQRKNIQYMTEKVKAIHENQGQLQGIELENGQMIEADKGFIAFGGNEVKSDFATSLGVERLENKHIVTDPRTKLTNVKNVWAAGDIGVHAEQVTIAMGEGSQAAIWIHKTLLNIARENAQQEAKQLEMV